MPAPYQLSIPTAITKSGDRVLATIKKACGSGEPTCQEMACCAGWCISDTLTLKMWLTDLIGPPNTPSSQCTLTYAAPSIDYPNGVWQYEDSGATACLVRFAYLWCDGSTWKLVAQFGAGAGGVNYQSGQLNVTACGPDFQIETPDFAAFCDSTGEGDTSRIIITGTSTEVADPSPHRWAIDTRLSKSGKRILAGIDCAGSGPSQYWIGVDTGRTKNGKRVLAGYDPCCDRSLDFVVNSACCPSGVNRDLKLTFMWRPQTTPPTTGYPNTQTADVGWYFADGVSDTYRGTIDICGTTVYIVVYVCQGSSDDALIWLSLDGYTNTSTLPQWQMNGAANPGIGAENDQCYPFYRHYNFFWTVVFGGLKPSDIFPCLDLGGSSFETNNIAAYLSV